MRPFTNLPAPYKTVEKGASNPAQCTVPRCTGRVIFSSIDNSRGWCSLHCHDAGDKFVYVDMARAA